MPNLDTVKLPTAYEGTTYIHDDVKSVLFCEGCTEPIALLKDKVDDGVVAKMALRDHAGHQITTIHRSMLKGRKIYTEVQGVDLKVREVN
ncbi:MAG: hypothetical protein WAV41_00720 [Microgenomates group bacterium]